MIFSLFHFSIYLRHDTISRSMDLGLGDFMFCFLLDIISSPSFFYFTLFFMRLMLGLSFFIYGCNNRFALYTHLARGRLQRSSICCVFGSGRKNEEKGLACDRSENDAICIYILYTIYSSMSDYKEGFSWKELPLGRLSFVLVLRCRIRSIDMKNSFYLLLFCENALTSDVMCAMLTIVNLYYIIFSFPLPIK
ncbi:hypothetical protein J3E68DRAFT_55759 [Trichoderma sp. SZMC 28012]